MEKDTKTILIVEVVAVIATEYAISLKNEGYNVLQVLNGDEAVKTVRSYDGNIDLILMDIDIGMKMDGIEVANEILEYKDIPIVFLSDHSEKRIIDRIEKISYGYVVKGSSLTALIASIRIALKLHSVHIELKRKEEAMFIKDLANESSIDAIGIFNPEGKKLENEIRDNERKFSMVFHFIPIPMAISRISDGVYVDVNQTFLQLFGYNRNEVIGHSAYDIDLWVNPDQRRDLVLQAAENNKIENLTVKFRTRTGSIINVLFSGTAIKFRDVPCFVASAQDITDMEKFSRALMESENKFKSLFENSMEAQLLVDGETIIDCNRMALTMIGTDRKEKIIGLTPNEISPEFQPDGKLTKHKLDYIIKKAIETGSAQIEWVHRRFDGVCIDSEVYLTTINIQGKTILHTTWRDITLRKLFEKNLIESEEKYRTLVNNLNIGIYRTSIDSGGKFISINPALAEIAGFNSEEEMKQYNVADFYPDYEARSDIINEIASRGFVKNKEINLKNKNGDLRIASVTAKVLHDADGNAKWIDGVLEDITERKKLEKALEQSESNYRYIFENSVMGIFQTTREGKIIKINNAFANMFGFNTPEVMMAETNGIIVNYYINPGDREKFITLLNKYDIVKDFEVEFVNKFGKRIWGSINSKAVRDSHGRFLYCEGTLDDITERKTAQDALRLSEEKFRRITELSLDIYVTIDTDRIIRFISNSILRYTGFKPADLIGTDFNQFVPLNEIKKCSNFFRDAFNGKAVGLFEINVYRKDKTIASVEASLVPVFNNLKVVALELYARDISDRRRLEQKIITISEIEQRRIGRDLHDGLGQTLTGISLMLGTVARKLQMKKPVRSAELSRIAKRVEIAIETTRRTAMGLCPVSMESDGLAVALGGMARSLENEYGIHCSMECSDMKSSLDISITNHLYYIALEAVTNSIKHGKAKSINILLANHERKILLIVRDDGKPDKIKKTKKEGMGLEIMKYRAGIIGALFSAGYIKNGYEVKIEM